ncbi:hypothetical protein Efla_002173 [Eimeria flavescens]
MKTSLSGGPPPQGPLKRFEHQLTALGLDCQPELCWNRWRPGEDAEKRIVLKNVGLTAAVVCYKPPQTRAFSLPLPKPRKLAPGISMSIPVTFRPQSDEPVEEKLEIFTEKGSAHVLLRAKSREFAACIQSAVDFGGVAVGSGKEEKLAITNTGSESVVIKWKVNPPFSIIPAICELPVGKKVICMAFFKPEATCTYTATAVCELLAPPEVSDSFSSHSAALATSLRSVRSAVPEFKKIADNTAECNKEEHGLTASAGFGQVVRSYQMELRGFAKIPYLLIEGKTEETVNFGEVRPGELRSKTLKLTNTSSVLAEFEIEECTDQRGSGKASGFPEAISVTTERSFIPPLGSTELFISLSSGNPGEALRAAYRIKCGIASAPSLLVQGRCQALDVFFSTAFLAMGEIKQGQKATRQVELRNNSASATTFSFPHLHPESILQLTPSSGAIPPKGRVRLSVSLSFCQPCCFFQRLFCFAGRAAQPLCLDVAATCTSDTEYPARIAQGHVDLEQWRLFTDRQMKQGKRPRSLIALNTFSFREGDEICCGFEDLRV